MFVDVFFSFFFQQRRPTRDRLQLFFVFFKYYFAITIRLHFFFTFDSFSGRWRWRRCPFFFLKRAQKKRKKNKQKEKKRNCGNCLRLLSIDGPVFLFDFGRFLSTPSLDPCSLSLSLSLSFYFSISLSNGADWRCTKESNLPPALGAWAVDAANPKWRRRRRRRTSTTTTTTTISIDGDCEEWRFWDRRFAFRWPSFLTWGSSQVPRLG